ncbi:hypothetical protein PMAYCL1PPCAC_29452, partial [Pristionchus mayeri]
QVDYVAVKGPVGKHLHRYVRHALKHRSLSEWKIFCFMLISCEKAVSLVYRKDIDLFCVLDSHAHDRNRTGSIVAVSNGRNLCQLSEWIESRLFADHKSTKSKKFELSLLQWTNSRDVPSLSPNIQVNVKIYHRPPSSKLHSVICTTMSPKSSFISLSSDSGYES